MSSSRKPPRRLGRNQPCRRSVKLGVEQLETRDLPSTLSLSAIPIVPPATISVAGTAVTPNDPSYSAQWNLVNTHVNQAWAVTTGSTKTTVALIDSGVDYNHPDLYKNIWINQKEIPLSRLKNLTDVDHDGLITFYDLNNPINQGIGKINDVNHDGRIDAADILAPMTLNAQGNDTGLGGWAHHSTQDGDILHPDDLIGWNFVANSNNPFDDLGHGTHVAGILGAMGNNGTGVAGVDWSIQMMALKFINSSGVGTLAAATAALNYSVAHGASISNNSWSGGGYDPSFFQALQNAQAHGQIFVAAAGNAGVNLDTSPSYPASYQLDNVVAVAATDHSNNLASWSNFGAHSVQLAAPGVSVYSTVPNANYQYYTGTSMAAPHVTGVLALLKSIHPDWTYKQLIARVLQTVEPVAALNGKVASGGLLDAGAALAPPPTAAPSTTPAPSPAAFVDHLYSDLLGRAPSSADLNSWLRALAAGTSRTRVARAVWESTEHRGREIDADYVHLLGRHVDSIHLNQWLLVLRNGGTETDVLRGILTSGDYTALHASNAAYVTSLYAKLLGRSPTSAELAVEVQKLLLHQSRATVAQDLLGSSEYLGALVDRDYTTFLLHHVDGTTQQLLIAGLQNGTKSPESVAVAILGSNEYFQRK